MGRLPGAAGLLVVTAARGWDAARTFERFTEPARQVVVRAQEEARTFRHDHIGTEHLLLGILREAQTPAARILTEHGVALTSVRARVAELVGAGQEEPGDQIPFTPRAKVTLELAMREALEHGNPRVEPEHLLLGLLRERDGMGVRILEGLVDDRTVLVTELTDALPAAEPGRPLPPNLAHLRAGAVPPAGPAGAPGLEIPFAPEVRRLLLEAALRAHDEGRTEITLADVEAAWGRPPEAAAG